MVEYVQFECVGMVDTIVRLKNSKNGNPRYLIALSNGIIGKTKSNAGFAYSIHSGMSWVKVKFHFTPKNKCVIDDITEE